MTLGDKYQVELTRWDELALQQLPTLSILAPTDNFRQWAQRSSTLIGVADLTAFLSVCGYVVGKVSGSDFVPGCWCSS